MTARRAIIREWYGKTLRLYFVADAHVLSAACDEDKVTELAGIIERDPFGLAVGLGDYIEAIAYDDKRFDPAELSQPIIAENLSNPFYQGALRFTKLFERTRGKWLCMVAGNHEERATHYTHFDPLPIIAERLGTVYHGGSDCGGWAKIIVYDESGERRNGIDLFLMHGYGAGELRGGEALRLQRLLMRKRADIVATGHGHKPISFPETIEYIDSQGFEHKKTCVGIEAYPLCGRHSYLSRRGANDPPTGYVVAEIEESAHGAARISVSLHEL